jgi:hypothetical protein
MQINSNLESFIVDEILNIIIGILHKINCNNLIYKYIDYFKLNQQIESFILINYIATIIPLLIYLLTMSLIIKISITIIKYILI